MFVQAAAHNGASRRRNAQADLHDVVHTPTGRKLGYGELASAAAKLPVPKKEELKFKPKSAWRYIGKGAAELRPCAMSCTGKAVYGMDARMEGMVYASIEQPPVLGGKVKSFDDKEALQVRWRSARPCHRSVSSRPGDFNRWAAWP